MDTLNFAINIKTPSIINNRILKFCDRIDTLNKPQYIKCLEYRSGEAGKCFDNVRRYILEFGGEMIVGWNIWIYKNIFIQAESHAVVETSKLGLVDVSPQKENRVLFLKDSGLQNLENPIKSRFEVLTDSEYSKQFVNLLDSIDEKRSISEEGFYLSQEELYLYQFLIKKFSEIRKGHEFCPCESGLKFKSCCGRK